MTYAEFLEHTDEFVGHAVELTSRSWNGTEVTAQCLVWNSCEFGWIGYNCSGKWESVRDLGPAEDFELQAAIRMCCIEFGERCAFWECKKHHKYGKICTYLWNNMICPEVFLCAKYCIKNGCSSRSSAEQYSHMVGRYLKSGQRLYPEPRSSNTKLNG